MIIMDFDKSHLSESRNTLFLHKQLYFMNAQQHQAYQKWLKELDFYEEEIVIFKKELNLLVEKHPSLLSIIEHVEEYQCIFEKKEKHIQTLREHIHKNNRVLSAHAVDGEESDWDFDKIQVEHQAFVNKLESLKKNFKRFVAKNMH